MLNRDLLQPYPSQLTECVYLYDMRGYRQQSFQLVIPRSLLRGSFIRSRHASHPLPLQSR